VRRFNCTTWRRLHQACGMALVRDTTNAHRLPLNLAPPHLHLHWAVQTWHGAYLGRWCGLDWRYFGATATTFTTARLYLYCLSSGLADVIRCGWTTRRDTHRAWTRRNRRRAHLPARRYSCLRFPFSRAPPYVPRLFLPFPARQRHLRALLSGAGRVHPRVVLPHAAAARRRPPPPCFGHSLVGVAWADTYSTWFVGFELFSRMVTGVLVGGACSLSLRF